MDWQVYQFVRVVKARKSEGRFPQGFCVILILNTFSMYKNSEFKGWSTE